MRRMSVLRAHLIRGAVALALLVLPAAAPELGAQEQAGSFVRFRVDALPEGKAQLVVTGVMKIHRAPWVTKSFPLTPEPVRAPGPTPWVDLRKLPAGGNGSLILSIPAGARGATQFALGQDEAALVREIGWDEPNGREIIVQPGLSDVRTFRDQERRYYLHASELFGGRLFPLTRPPLLFSNAWGHVTGGAAEYMVKSFRILGLNAVSTSADHRQYEELYGWGSQGGHYGPPRFLPYDEDEALGRYAAHYRNYFETGRGKGLSKGMRVFQMADEPREIPLKAKQANDGFRAWLAEQGLKPRLFGKKTWEEVSFSPAVAKTPEQQRLFYWSRRYQGAMTPKMFALACKAFRQSAPSDLARPYVALSGHALYFGNRLPLDMFDLAAYPDMTPGISDWMATGGSWWWDSHQAVAFSVAPFNAGARRYGKDYGTRPISFPMMHCVWPNNFRVYTQLANQCKLISYYNYGPDYNVTEGHWSATDWVRRVVYRANNRCAQVDDILSPGLIRPSRVALLYARSTEYRSPQIPFLDKRAAFLALSHDYYQPELVTEEQVADGALAHYDALYVVDPWVSAPAREAIGRWVKEGGMLWACADTLTRDEYGESDDLLKRLGGLKRSFGQRAGGEALRISPVPGEAEFAAHGVPADGRPGAVSWRRARVRARYGDGVPAWLEKDVGKGRLVYVGHRCGLSYSRRKGRKGAKAIWPASGRELLTQPLLERGVVRELELSQPVMMASPISTDRGTVIVLFNLTTQQPQGLRLRLREPKRPYSVQCFDAGLTLQDLPFDYEDGCAVMTLPTLDRRGTMVLVRRTPAPADERPARMREAAERHLASDHWQTLSAGAWFGGFFPDWQLGPRLTPLLDHEHWAVRRSAAEALGRLGHQAAAPALRAAAGREQDAHALADEIAALARLGHPDAAALVQSLRESPDPFRRREADRIAKLLPKSKEGAVEQKKQ